MGRLQEYISKDLLSRSGLTIPKGTIVSNDSFNLDSVTFPLVVKAQIPIGGRGKSGGIKIANSRSEATDIINSMIGSSINGVPVDTVLLEEKVDIKQELYVSVFIDRDKSNALLMISEYGGIDIEELDSEKILKININPLTGIKDYMLRSVIGRMSLDSDVIDSVKNVIRTIYDIFIQYDAELVEINPLVITGENNIICLDAKVNFDSNALFRHPEYQELIDPSEEDEAELKASEFGLSYIKLDGNIGCLVNGAGLAMATMDIIKLYGAEPANFLDVGGAATKELVTEAFKIILSDKNVEGILVNIFGGIMRCDVVAEGIISAANEVNISVPLVVRLEGTNVDLGKKIIEDSDLSIISASDLDDASKKITEAI